MKPPALGPRVGASIAKIPATSVALVRAGHSNIRNTPEKTSGISAPPQNPCTTRAGISVQKLVDAAQAPKVIHQAIGTAYAGRGVAHLTIPVDVMASAAHGEPLSLATLRPRAEIAPAEADLVEIAQRIDRRGIEPGDDLLWRALGHPKPRP